MRWAQPRVSSGPTGDAGGAQPALAEAVEGAWLRLRMAGVIWRLGVTWAMRPPSSGDMQSSEPVSSWMLGSPRPSPARRTPQSAVQDSKTQTSLCERS